MTKGFQYVKLELKGIIMFTLIIVFSIIFQGEVGFLTNDFCWGRLVCNNGTTSFISEADVKKTFHIFKLPKGDQWECSIIGYGDGYTFPSEKDFIKIVL